MAFREVLDNRSKIRKMEVFGGGEYWIIFVEQSSED